MNNPTIIHIFVNSYLEFRNEVNEALNLGYEPMFPATIVADAAQGRYSVFMKLAPPCPPK